MTEHAPDTATVEPLASTSDALHALSDLLRARAHAATREMQTNSTYWGPEATDEAFTKGIDNAVGDEHLASSFTPGVANTLADLVDLFASTPRDLCLVQDNVYNTARELAERYPGLDLSGDWPIALRPVPPEPLEFGALITGWTGTPDSLTEWVRLADGYWASKTGRKYLYEDIVVTGIGR